MTVPRARAGAAGPDVPGRSVLAEAAARTTGSSARSPASRSTPQNHVWVVHRGAVSLNARTEIGLATNPPTARGVLPAGAPGAAVRSGRATSSRTGVVPGEGYDWPQSPGGDRRRREGQCLDRGRQVPAEPQLGGRGRGAAPATPAPRATAADAHVLKFAARRTSSCCRSASRARPRAATAPPAFIAPRPMDVDAAANEVYVADGLGNRRIVVFDAETGAYKRHWGAYGAKPDDRRYRRLRSGRPCRRSSSARRLA